MPTTNTGMHIYVLVKKSVVSSDSGMSETDMELSVIENEAKAARAAKRGRTSFGTTNTLRVSKNANEVSVARLN